MTQQQEPESTQAADGGGAAGRFVWHELMSTDPDAARSFYSGLFGWDYDTIPMPNQQPGGPSEYPMIRVGETTIGGVMPVPGEGVPSHWMGYVSVDDVDNAANSAKDAGGQIHMPGTDIPEMGRFAIVADPSGALISLWKSASGPDMEPDGAATGTFVWNELLTTDPASCADFYTKIFDWNVESMKMPGPQGEMTYHLFKRSNQKDGSGMMEMPPGAEAPPHWLPYVAVEDVDASVERARELGAQVYCEPTDIPNVGRFAVLADPQGASFAVYKGTPTDC